MLKQIKNETIEIVVDTLGAELQKVKSVKEGKDYLWEGDSKYWGQQSPLLFPIASGLKGGTYLYQGKEYTLKNHGFAAISEFELVEETSNSLKYRLQESDETLKCYPFKFELYVIYTLGVNTVKVTYQVLNTNDKNMYFSIGGHPGFVANENSYVQFDKSETSKRMLFDQTIGLLTKDKTPVFNDEKRIYNHFKHFDNDTIMFDDLKTKVVNIKNDELDTNIKFSFEDFPYLAVWSKTNSDTKTTAPFICVEPWCGLTDYVDTNKDIKQKGGIEELEPNKLFEVSYTIEIVR